MIYIREAHPTDGWWLGKGPLGLLLKLKGTRAALDVSDPQTIEERRAVAGRCEVSLAYGIRTYVDEMDDAVNEAYAALRMPLSRALYLLQLSGMSQEDIDGQQVDGGFLIEQMELREKLESLHDLVDPDTVLDHLVTEISGDIKAHQAEFADAYAGSDLAAAASACVKMQYLFKLLHEAEQVESELMDS